MTETRWKAATNVVVAGEPIKAGATFTAAAEAVAEAIKRGLVVPAPAEKKTESKKTT